MMLEPSDAVLARALEFGASLDGPLGQALRAYLERLLAINRMMNLTAITDPLEAWTKHILDSLSLLPYLAALPAGEVVVDIGSGGGLPAIPLALAAPSLSFTLVEATRKKAVFLSETAQALGMKNVTVVAERAEVIGQGPLRQRCAVVTARAVARLSVLLELTLPLLRSGGQLLAIKGGQASLELAEGQKAMAVLGGAVRETVRTDTGTILRIEKVASTPPRYPRRPGEPNRSPLA